MFKLSLFPIFQAAIVFIAISCAVPAEKKSSAATEPKKKENPIEVEPSQPGCIPTGANNNCTTLATSPIIDRCWMKILDNDVAKACATKGKFYNRVTKQCVDDASLNLKPGCTMQDVYTVNAPAGYTKDLIDSNVATVKATIKGPSGLNTTEEPILDQCIQTTTADHKAFLIPVFLGKKYTGATDGSGSYEFNAGKICDSTNVPACSNPSLLFPTPTDPVTKKPIIETVSCN